MWLVLFIIIFSLIYYLGKRNYDFWKNQGIPGPKPTLFVGNIGQSLIGTKTMDNIIGDIYREYEGYPFVGIYRIGTPCLLIRDPAFLKNALVKDFKSFHDNDIHIDKDADRIGSRNPFCLKGLEWKQKRALLTSCFTSGKIKGMFPILKQVSERMVKYIENSIETSNLTLEAREVCVRYTLDNVAACAFGLEGKCFEEEYSEFRKLADQFLSPGVVKMLMIMMLSLFPKLASILKIGLIPKEVENKLINMVTSTLKHRKDNNIKRNDFLEYINEVSKDSDVFANEIDVTGQAAAFFADGYETSSRVMSFVVFELARNPHIQEKLRKEINAVCAKHNGDLTYEAVQEMPYLDACFNESMRKYPIISQLFKLCTEQYTYTSTNPEYKEMTVTIKPGTPIVVPFGHLQKDKKYIDNPDEYIPERLLEKDDNIKNVFKPFGDGPRACLGMRFGQTQIKLGLAQLVKNFEMTVNGKTQLPLKFDPWYFLLAPIGGLWIDFKAIR